MIDYYHPHLHRKTGYVHHVIAWKDHHQSDQLLYPYN